jgi:2-keto-4-pentenoate hydratase
MLSPADRRVAAMALLAAERDRVPIPPLRDTFAGLDLDDAYAIQALILGEKLAAGGILRGHKVGLTSKAMQDMLGVDQPDYGFLLDTMLVHDGGTVDASRLCAPRIEPEVAFVLGDTLPAVGCTVADVLRATAFVSPALEIIDSRVAAWNIRLLDTVADNASSCRVVLGARATPVAGLDLRTLGAVLRRNGEIAETGAMGAVLGNPALAVAWLANTLGRYGVGLGAGQIVLPGACTRAIPVQPGDHVEATFAGLGRVGVRFVGGSP